MVSKILDIHVRKTVWSSHLCRPVAWPKSSCLFFYLGAWLSLVIIQAEIPVTTNGWLQTNKKFATRRESVKERREKTAQMEDTRDNSSMLMLYILIVLCMSYGLICACITGIHDKRIITSCTMWHLLQIIGALPLLSSILSAGLSCDNMSHR